MIGGRASGVWPLDLRSRKSAELVRGSVGQRDPVREFWKLKIEIVSPIVLYRKGLKVNLLLWICILSCNFKTLTIEIYYRLSISQQNMVGIYYSYQFHNKTRLEYILGYQFHNYT